MAKNENQSFVGYILIATVLFAIGVVFIIFKESLKTLALAVGVLLAVFAIVYGILATASKKRDFSFAVKISIAVIALTCGAVTAILNEKAVDIMASLFALLLIVDGSFKLNTSAMSKRYSVKCWWLLLIPSVPLIAGGFYLIKYTPQDIATLTLMLGILIIIDSLINYASAVFVTKFEKNLKAQAYYEVYREKLSKSDDVSLRKNTNRKQ